MFTTFLIEQQMFAYRYPGLQRLISLAQADSTFAHTLINDPVVALDQAPAGITLAADEYQLVIAVQASADLAEFTTRLCVLAYVQAGAQAEP